MKSMSELQDQQEIPPEFTENEMIAGSDDDDNDDNDDDDDDDDVNYCDNYC